MAGKNRKQQTAAGQMKTKTKRNNGKKPQQVALEKDRTDRGRSLLKESEEIVLAIRQGKVDALVMNGPGGDQVLTLRDTQHAYRMLVETVNEGAATLDPGGTVLYANKRCAEILRIPFEKFIGSPLQTHVPSEERAALQELLQEGMNGNVRGEVRLTTHGRPRQVRLAFSPLQVGDQKNICMVATELTELMEANEALRSNEESLRQLSARLLKLQDEERRRIARDLHDITGQKLAAQSISLSRILTRKTPALDVEARRTLGQCAKLSKQIGEEIRTLSYLLHPPLLDELGLPSAVKWYAEGFEQRTGIQVAVHVDADFPRLMPDVEVTLFRVVQESLTNIHRYSGSARAEVRAAVDENDVKVQIVDFGKGMNGDMLNPATGNVAPLGVGIQGMKERMRQLGGKLTIDSRLEQGTVVSATLPLALATVSMAAEAEVSEIPPTAGRAGRTGSRKQILLADDHEMLRRGIRTMLMEETNWAICGEATDGQDAVDKAMALYPDLVILDINMPVLNGLAAVRQILRHRPDTKILIFTVHDSEQTAKEIRAAGAHAFLSKGIGSEDLLRVVRELLEDRASGLDVVAAANA